MWNVWNGRRDRIPPTTDRRTLTIDRAMVARGMVSPDELAEMHTLGDEMNARLEAEAVIAAEAAAVGQQAVDALRTENARIKAEKKAAAAARRAAHAKAVAERFATDIVYLGRGVSAGLAERVSDAERLAKHRLPIWHTPADVATGLGLTIPTLRWLAFHHEAPRHTHYTQFAIAKKSGGSRTLAAPKRRLKAVQRQLLEEVFCRIEASRHAHGFVAQRSTLTNARPHVGAAVVVNLDLIDFFPSIHFGRVKGLLQERGYCPAVAAVLASLVTESPRRTLVYAGDRREVASGRPCLPQGACTSPAIANAIAFWLDRQLAAYAAAADWTYTRYADDLTFSTTQPEAQVGRLLAAVRHMVQRQGFAVNEKKTRVLRPNTRQSVTGIVVNEKPSSPRPLRRRLRAILHNARATGLEAQNRDRHPNFRMWVEGQLAYLEMIDRDQAAPLRKAYEALPH